MNYIKQFNHYWAMHERNSLGSHECTLYFYLLKRCNSLGWAEEIEVQNSVAMDFLDLSYRDVQSARDRLQAAGLIQFKSKAGSKVVRYVFYDADIGGYTKSYAANAEVCAKVYDEVKVEVANEVGDEVVQPPLGINNKLKQKPKLTLTQAGAGVDLFFENHYSHSQILQATVNDDVFLEQAVMAIRNAGISTFPNVFKQYCAARLAEMELTGESSKYSLGSIRRILLQDFKFNHEKNKFLQMRQIRGGEVKPYISKRRQLA